LLRYLPFLIDLVLTVYALFSCVQTPDDEVPHLPKLIWVLLIVLVPFVGPITWLLVSRAAQVSSGGPTGGGTAYGPRAATGSPPARASAPDDDPEFLAWLERQQRRRARPDAPKDGTTPADGSTPGDDAEPGQSDPA
jgi:hypothetical protein